MKSTVQWTSGGAPRCTSGSISLFAVLVRIYSSTPQAIFTRVNACRIWGHNLSSQVVWIGPFPLFLPLHVDKNVGAISGGFRFCDEIRSLLCRCFLVACFVFVNQPPRVDTTHRHYHKSLSLSLVSVFNTSVRASKIILRDTGLYLKSHTGSHSCQWIQKWSAYLQMASFKLLCVFVCFAFLLRGC